MSENRNDKNDPRNQNEPAKQAPGFSEDPTRQGVDSRVDSDPTKQSGGDRFNSTESRPDRAAAAAAGQTFEGDQPSRRPPDQLDPRQGVKQEDKDKSPPGNT